MGLIDAAEESEALTSGGFTTHAMLSSGIADQGETAVIQVDVKAAKTSTVLVDIEVYDSTGTRVNQQFWDNQTLQTGAVKSFTLDWAVPVSQKTGSYLVKIGVFAPNWASTYQWNPGALKFNVNAATGTPPSDGGTVVTPDAGTPDAGSPPLSGNCSEQTDWRATTGFAPLSDSAARARVCAKAENRPLNVTPNAYVPSATELSTFENTRDNNGNTNPQNNPYAASVTGGCGGTGVTTDEIIQCTAAKWGIPANWLRAEYIVESNWEQIDPATGQPSLGDKVNVGTTEAAEYPSFAQERDSNGNLTGNVWQSLGLTQVRWTPTGTVGAGTEPLRWKSTAFNADFQAATVRFYYDNPQGLRSGWGDAYAAGNQWLSIGGWFNPYPWNNSGQQDYVTAVQAKLSALAWEAAGF